MDGIRVLSPLNSDGKMVIRNIVYYELLDIAFAPKPNVAIALEEVEEREKDSDIESITSCFSDLFNNE
jgi:hypothetical protein